MFWFVGLGIQLRLIKQLRLIQKIDIKQLLETTVYIEK